jgi:PAS domain S-box-containing protein
VHSAPIKAPEKGVEGVVIRVDEITTEIEQKMEARLQSLFSESLTESLPAALIVLDGRDRVTTWNQTAARLLGVDSESAIGKELFSLETPLAKGVFRRRFQKAKQQSRQKKLRIRMEVKGEPAQCIVTQCPFRSRDDTPCGTLLLLEEVATK